MDEQKLVNLAKANERRLAHVEIRRRVADGSLLLADAMEDPIVASMPIYKLLRAQRGWGSKKTGALLARLLLSGSTRVGALTDRQKALILDRACRRTRQRDAA